MLRRVTPPGDAADEARLAASSARLFAEREKRVKPARDDKILADWNGLTIAALARGAAVFDAPEFLDAARARLRLRRRTLRDGRRPPRSMPGARAARRRRHARRLRRDGARGAEPVRGDGRAGLSERRDAWADAAQDLFGDDDGGFYLTARDAPERPDRASAPGP